MRVISGAQTGVDRAALDAAMSLGIDVGGWCPKGRKSERGKIPARYPVVETPSADYPQRTEWNVRDSDATLILYHNQMTPGTAQTRKLCMNHNKPTMLIDLAHTKEPSRTVVEWVAKQAVINIAGPRESKRPGIQAQATTFLTTLFGKILGQDMDDEEEEME